MLMLLVEEVISEYAATAKRRVKLTVWNLHSLDFCQRIMYLKYKPGICSCVVKGFYLF